MRTRFAAWSIPLAVAIACSGAKNDGASSSDPFADLRTVAKGELKCSGDQCCYGYCAGTTFSEGGTSCLSRDPQMVAHKLVSPATCTGIVFSEEFYNRNCYVIIESRADGSSDWVGSHWGVSDGTVNIPVVCLCGQSGGTAASFNYAWTNFAFGGCDQVVRPTSWPDALSVCSGGCSGCQPSCSGRQCGSNGCGGSCGTCSAGATCSANGACVSGGTGETCDGCLSSCRGISGCCTGCGCICQSACGGVCW